MLCDSRAERLAVLLAESTTNHCFVIERERTPELTKDVLEAITKELCAVKDDGKPNQPFYMALPKYKKRNK